MSGVVEYVLLYFLFGLGSFLGMYFLGRVVGVGGVIWFFVFLFVVDICVIEEDLIGLRSVLK